MLRWRCPNTTQFVLTSRPHLTHALTAATSPNNRLQQAPLPAQPAAQGRLLSASNPLLAPQAELEASALTSSKASTWPRGRSYLLCCCRLSPEKNVPCLAFAPCRCTCVPAGAPVCRRGVCSGPRGQAQGTRAPSSLQLRRLGVVPFICGAAVDADYSAAIQARSSLSLFAPSLPRTAGQIA